MFVGPSPRPAVWRAFFDTPSPRALGNLMATEADVGHAFFEIESYIDGIYQAVELERVFGHLDARHTAPPTTRLRELELLVAPYRAALGPYQTELSLGLLRVMRRSGCLSLVLGAGVTMDAGGPSWAALVEELLTRALLRGRSRFRMQVRSSSGRQPRLGPDGSIFLSGARSSLSAQRVEEAAAMMTPRRARAAEAILASIRTGSASTEDLKTGMQLCSDLLGQSLFTDVTGILYASRGPGAIHRSIAALAAPARRSVRRGQGGGWEAIITYNFDDLMGEALDATGLARCAYAQTNAGVAGDPNAKARAGGRQAAHLKIYHLHGYTPRRPFLITDTKFTFSTAQYEETYGGATTGIIGDVFARYLARPVSRALYIGCSFEDEAMNDLLAAAARALPGRYHYALVRWGGKHSYRRASEAKLAKAAAPYLSIGVRPIWFDRFSDIPGLIGQLA